MQFDMYLESTKVTPLNARVSYMGTTFISALIPSFIYSLSINQIWEHEFVFLWLFGQFGQYLTRLTWLIHTSVLPLNWNPGKIFVLTVWLGQVHTVRKIFLIFFHAGAAFFKLVLLTSFEENQKYFSYYMYLT